MALNPAFTPQGTRKLPLLFGYTLGVGDPVLSTVALNGAQFALDILSEGEIDGLEMAGTFQVAGTSDVPGVPSHMVGNPVLTDENPQRWSSETATVLHFHSGAYTPIGTVIPTLDPVTGLIPKNASQDAGPTQGYDPWFAQFPTVTPPQSFSGIAYAIWGLPAPPAFIRGNYAPSTISGMAVWRGLRCRIFDAYGNVVGYQFTCNPAWHKVEAILRRKIKPEQPAVDGLTAAEKACFNWDSIVELAARNDFLLPNGKPRFVGNYAFAADATLANMLELMCRVDRSFQRIDDGKIVLQGDDARASVFIASAKHLVPNTLKLDHKDVSKAPNIFVPNYRDLDIPAVSTVISGVSYGGFYLGSAYHEGFRALTCTTPSPFSNQSFMTYGGCSDPSWDGNYRVTVFDESGDPYPKGSLYPNKTYAIMPTPAGTPIENVTGGYLGSNDARFKPRSPDGVQHRSAQRMKGPQAPGLATQPTKIRVIYDCGNSTFDQTNRLMKFERDRELGTDTGAGWLPPIAGTLSLYYEAQDVNGAQLPLQAKTHNVITLDDWLFPEGPGDYEIMSMKIRPASGDSVGQIDLTLHAYNRNAYTDVSDGGFDGNSYLAVPNSSLKLTGFALPANTAWVLNATLAVAADTNGDGKLTITIPDLSIQIMGKTAPTRYPDFSVSGVPQNTPVTLYVDDPNGNGVGATYGWFAGTGVVSPVQTAPQSRGYSYFLQSSGPGSKAAGDVVTIYYSDSTLAGPDLNLQAAFSNGPLYLNCSFTGGPQPQGPFNDVRVTGMGLASPPGQPRQFYYFTFEVPSSQSIYYEGSGHAGYTANYQIVESGTSALATGEIPVVEGSFSL